MKDFYFWVLSHRTRLHGTLALLGYSVLAQEEGQGGPAPPPWNFQDHVFLPNFAQGRLSGIFMIFTVFGPPGLKFLRKR